MALTQILLVEDDPHHIVLTQLAFEAESFAGRLHVASKGQAAIDYLAGNPPFEDRAAHPVPNLIILDLGLPDMSGFEVLTWLQASEHAGIPIVVFTDSLEVDAAQRAFDLGARAYRRKAVDFTSLVDTVQEVMGRWGQELEAG